MSNIYTELGCICLRWATADEEDRTLDIQPSLNVNHVLEGEYHGLAPFSSIESTVTVVRSNIAIAPFTDQLPWSSHRFYLNRFMSTKALTMVLYTELSQYQTEKILYPIPLDPVCHSNVSK